jgi:hypothetical protein
MKFAFYLVTLWLIPIVSGFGFQTTYNVEIDGLTGTITTPLPKDYLRPGDKVTVRVVRADFIHYSYKITVKDEEIKVSYPVVGLPLLADGQSSSGSGSGGETKDFRPSGDPENRLNELIREYQVLSHALEAAKGKTQATINILEEVEQKGLAVWDNPGVCGWPCDYVNAVTNFFAADGLPATRKAIGETRSGLVILKRELELFKIHLNTGSHEVGDDLQNWLTAVSDLVQSVQAKISEIEALNPILKASQEKALRWRHIISTSDPEITKTILVKRGNFRYTVDIQRQGVSEQAKLWEVKLATGSGSDNNADNYQTITSFSFEGHTLYRLNLSLGVAALFTDEISYAVQTAPGVMENELSYVIGESSDSGYDLKPIVSLGGYFRAVDPFDENRKGEWMWTFGAEVKDSPDHYLLGVAYDKPSGVSYGFGITTYKETELAQGWEVGSTIPIKDDMSGPKFTDLPTKTTNEIGFYAHLSFRPVIFKNFWQKVKGK